MSCDSRKVGEYLAGGCEYTKAYVRCFPLLALVVALMVSCRQILQHRMYYELLKHGVLLDIENFSALADPLFQVVIWCALNATGHFVMDIVTAEHMVSHDLKHIQGIVAQQSFMSEVKKIAAFYLVP